jgi:peptidase E
MTKYILIGGYADRADDGGKALCQEMVDGFDQPVRILVCLFARSRETWEKLFEDDRFFFAKQLPKLKTILTMAQPESFVEQIKKADVIYFRGGPTRQLIDMVSACKGWEDELDGKTVAGTSAGANFLAKQYYSLDNLEVQDGLNILPIKVLVHYRSDYNAPNIDWNKAYHALDSSGDEDMQLLTLHEGEFKVIEQ